MALVGIVLFGRIGGEDGAVAACQGNEKVWLALSRDGFGFQLCRYQGEGDLAATGKLFTLASAAEYNRQRKKEGDMGFSQNHDTMRPGVPAFLSSHSVVITCTVMPPP